MNAPGDNFTIGETDILIESNTALFSVSYPLCKYPEIIPNPSEIELPEVSEKLQL
jgi:hypothetical protein